MLANAVLVASICIFMLSIADDYLLSRQQKERIADTTLRLWNRLDELKKHSYLDMLRTGGFQVVSFFAPLH
jgi:hypothetical protein